MTCSRPSHEVYLHIEEGVMDEHATSCPECQAALRVARSFREVFPLVGAEQRPPAGWQARVLASMESGRAPALVRAARPERRWRWAVIAVPAALAAALLLYIVWPHDHREGGHPLAALDVELTIRHGSEIQRAKSAAVGDLVTVETRGGQGRAVIWVYRNGSQLLLRCPEDAPCAARDGQMTVQLRIDRPGIYQILAAESAREVPPPAASIDESISAVALAGARYKMVDIEVF